MDVLGPAARIGVDPYRCTSTAEEELARLRAQVAWLEAERAALSWAVGHDELTGLANRRLFARLAPPLLRTGLPAVVFVVDLNGFKPINDSLGHDAGDRVLQCVAQRLAARAGDGLVARVGGDEFTGVLTQARGAPAQWWRPVVAALSAAIAEPMGVAGRILRVTASIGVAPAHDGVVVGELLRRADLAMYHAKLSGGCYAAWGKHAVAGPDLVELPGPAVDVPDHVSDQVTHHGTRRPALPAAPAHPDTAAAANSAPRIVEITLFPRSGGGPTEGVAGLA